MIDREILIVEDEQPVREMMAFGLSCAGFAVREAVDARSARAQVADHAPALLLIDWMLPDLSGLELTRALKSSPRTRDLPIIIVSARAAETDKIQGLNSGADDYVTKPFSPKELIARIQLVLRRAAARSPERSIRLNGLTLDQESRSISIGRVRLQAPLTEYRLLEFFMKNPERVYTRDQLAEGVWGSETLIEERTVDVHIMRLRRVLDEARLGHLVQTVRGVGYRLSSELGRAR